MIEQKRGGEQWEVSQVREIDSVVSEHQCAPTQRASLEYGNQHPPSEVGSTQGMMTPEEPLMTDGYRSHPTPARAFVSLS